MLIGYARVSTEEQNLDLQLRALHEAGCAKIFKDRGVSGTVSVRRGLDRTLKTAKPGDVLVVWKLDRLGRSLPHLIDTITALRDRDVGFLSLQEQIDTTSAGGRFYLHILAALAEFEREMIRDRTKAGMAAAKKRGVRLGRPPKLSSDEVALALSMLDEGQTRTAVAEHLDVNILTLRRALISKPPKQSKAGPESHSEGSGL